MKLKEQLAREGEWLFRWRSYLPLLLLPVLLVALREPPFIQHLWGGGAEKTYEALCIAISFFGLFIRCYTIGYTPAGTSGRNTKQQKASTLNTTGIYSAVRHPLYLGNFIIYLGIFLFTQSWWAFAIAVLAFTLYYERIMLAEESFLEEKFGDEFSKWAAETPAFFPSFKHWRRPALSLSIRNILKREYSGLFGIVVTFTFLEASGRAIREYRFALSLPWIVFFAAGLAVYVVLRTLKKKTRILHVEGR